MKKKKNMMLKVMSIILIVAGALNLLSNISLLTSTNLMNLAQQEVNLSGEALTAYLIVCIIFGFLELLCGIFGLKASKHFNFAETCFKLAITLIVFAAVMFLFNTVENGFTAKSLGGFAFPLLYLFSIRFCK